MILRKWIRLQLFTLFIWSLCVICLKTKLIINVIFLTKWMPLVDNWRFILICCPCKLGWFVYFLPGLHFRNNAYVSPQFSPTKVNAGSRDGVWTVAWPLTDPLPLLQDWTAIILLTGFMGSAKTNLAAQCLRSSWDRFLVFRAQNWVSRMLHGSAVRWTNT